jgi:hypothetical protein
MEHHNKTVAGRFLEETEDRNREPAYAHLCTADHREHDPAVPQETVGRDEAARVYRELVAAFGLRHTAESMVAEGDLVGARFTVAVATPASTRDSRRVAGASRYPVRSP